MTNKRPQKKKVKARKKIADFTNARDPMTPEQMHEHDAMVERIRSRIWRPPAPVTVMGAKPVPSRQNVQTLGGQPLTRPTIMQRKP